MDHQARPAMATILHRLRRRVVHVRTAAARATRSGGRPLRAPSVQTSRMSEGGSVWAPASRDAPRSPARVAGADRAHQPGVQMPEFGMLPDAELRRSPAYLHGPSDAEQHDDHARRSRAAAGARRRGRHGQEERLAERGVAPAGDTGRSQQLEVGLWYTAAPLLPAVWRSARLMIARAAGGTRQRCMSAELYNQASRCTARDDVPVCDSCLRGDPR